MRVRDVDEDAVEHGVVEGVLRVFNESRDEDAPEHGVDLVGDLQRYKQNIIVVLLLPLK